MKRLATAIFAFVMGAALWQMWPTYAQQLPMLVGQACIVGTQWVPCQTLGLNSGNVSGNIAATGTGTTGAVTAQLNPTTSTRNYVCGFVLTSATANGTGTVRATMTNVMGTTMNFTYYDSGQGLMGATFPQCLPATNVGSAILLTLPSDGNRTDASINIWGYTQ